MASVLGWLPQPAGLGLACAGWPGSNGSTMAANGCAVVAAGADGPPDADVAAGLVPDEGEDEDEELPLLPQPAAATPIRAANTAARATYRPIHATSAIPPVLAMIVAGSRVMVLTGGHPGQRILSLGSTNSGTIGPPSKYRRGRKSGTSCHCYQFIGQIVAVP